jgi:mono/diheme cytochrome c family protein
MKSPIFIFCMLALATAIAAAADAPSIQRGKELFNSTSLGTNGKSCSSCHRDGRGLDQIADKDEAALADTVNQCILKPLKGKELAGDSNDLKSLVMYLQTLGSTGK